MKESPSFNYKDRQLDWGLPSFEASEMRNIASINTEHSVRLAFTSSWRVKKFMNKKGERRIGLYFETITMESNGIVYAPA